MNANKEKSTNPNKNVNTKDIFVTIVIFEISSSLNALTREKFAAIYTNKTDIKAIQGNGLKGKVW